MNVSRNILLIVLLVIYLISAAGIINKKEKDQRIHSLSVCIVDSARTQFIHEVDILDILEERNFNILGREYDYINLEAIEESLINRQIIQSAEAYITEPGILHIDINQKDPFLRVFNDIGEGYYLDRSGNIIPLSSGFSPYILIASGYISEPFMISKTLNINDVSYDSLSRSKRAIYDVFRLAGFITADKFWNAQIEQIYVNEKYEYELIPRVGSQIIEFGSIEDMEQKFEKLNILYQNGFNNLGWNIYSKISLKYKNQVVCTKIY